MTLVKHDFIQDRAQFFVVLDQAIAEATRLNPPTPAPALVSILRQLAAVKSWTANGRAPTKDERRSITIGTVVVRELEPAPNDELYALMQRLYELNMYIKLWWDDAEWQAMDDKDMRVAFPDKYAK